MLLTFLYYMTSEKFMFINLLARFPRLPPPWPSVLDIDCKFNIGTYGKMLKDCQVYSRPPLIKTYLLQLKSGPIKEVCLS